jgi:hypothetical protein
MRKNLALEANIKMYKKITFLHIENSETRSVFRHDYAQINLIRQSKPVVTTLSREEDSRVQSKGEIKIDDAFAHYGEEQSIPKTSQ